MLARVFDGSFHKRRPAADDGARRRARDPAAVRDRSAPARGRGLEPGEVGIVVAGIKSLADVKIGDTLSDAARPRRRAAAGLPRREADGVRRALSRRSRRLREPEGRAREAPAERRLARLRARDQRRARLRLPLRLPRLPARRDRAGAARARVQPQPDLDGADRALPRSCKLSGETQEIESPAELPDPTEIRADRGADGPRHDPRAAGVRGRRPRALPGAPRHAARHDAARLARAGALRAAALGDRSRLPRPHQER